MLIIGCLFVIFGLLASIYIIISEGNYIILFTSPLLIIVPIGMYKDVSKIKSISFDEISVYISQTDIQIPFKNIRSIEYKPYYCNYEIKLMRPIEDHSKIWFKASLWYPYNFNKKEEKVKELRDKIDSHKQKI